MLSTLFSANVAIDMLEYNKSNGSCIVTYSGYRMLFPFSFEINTIVSMVDMLTENAISFLNVCMDVCHSLFIQMDRANLVHRNFYTHHTAFLH